MQTNKQISKRIITILLAFVMIFSNFTGVVEVFAAVDVKAPTINPVFYDATTITGGNLAKARVNKKLVIATVHVILKGEDATVKATLSDNPTKGTTWSVNLPDGVKVAKGDTVTVYQQIGEDKSPEVTENAKQSKAATVTLTMPTGEIWIEQTSSNQVNDDEQAEAIEMLKKANLDIANDFDLTKTKFSIDSTDHAYYEVTYTDGSTAGKIEATGLKIQQVKETSATPTIEKVQVMDKQIIVTLNKEVVDGTKFYFVDSLTQDNVNFCKNGNCKVVKTTPEEMSQSISINGKKVIFPVKNDNVLDLDKEFGVIIKEPHKFRSCARSKPVVTIPDKIAVKDPKKLKPEEKEQIAQAIRKANTTSEGISKLPNGTGDWEGVPAVIQIDDSGNVKIFSGNDVAGNWDPNNNFKFVPETNEDGSVKLNTGSESKTTFDKPEELLSNLPPDAPKIENKDENVVITPNFEVDTDAKKVIIEFKGENGYSKTIVAEKTDTGWTINDSNAKVDENGVVTIPTKNIKDGTTITASVEDNGGLVPEEPALDSGKEELLIKNKYKVVYKAGKGSGNMVEKEIEAGEEYTILDNAFTPPAEKEFDYWQVGSDKKQPGDKLIINNDTEITAIYKYIINPTANEIETVVGHPVSYEMYKNTIKGFPSELTVEHIEVKEAPDISKVGSTQAKIEVRFSDGQFRTIPVTVNVKADQKDKEIEKLNKDIEGLNNQVTDLNKQVTNLNNTITEKDKEITKLNEKVTACETQCKTDKATCEAEKTELNNQINKLTEEKIKLENDIATKNQEIAKIKEDAKKVSDELAKEKKTNEELNNKVTELNNKITETEKNLKDANNKVSDLGKQLKEANDKVTNLEAEKKTLTEKVVELDKQVTDKQKEIDKLNNDVTNLNNQIETLNQEKEAEKKAHEQEKKDLEKQLQDAKDIIATKEQEIATIKEEVEKVKKELEDEKTENANLNKQVTDLSDKVDKANQDLKETKDKVTNLENQVKAEQEKNKALEEEKEKITKEKEQVEKEKQTLVNEKEKLEKEKEDLGNQVKEITKDKEDLDKKVKEITEEKEKLVTEVEKIKEETGKNQEGQTEKIKELEKKIEEKDKVITEINNKIKEAENIKKQAEEKIKKLNEKINTLETKPQYNDRYYPSYIYVDRTTTTTTRLEKENKDLEEKIKYLKQQGKNCDKENYVTVFQINSILYKTYVGDELLTQGEMTDFKGFIKPFIVNDRTMIPLRYVALALGLEVEWNNDTRTAIFTNTQDRHNALKQGKITINADTLEMKDQNGKVIAVDSKPILREGRFYVSLTNLTKAFGGTNGTTTDGVKNTIEWDNKDKKVLVYKYVK